MRAFGTTSPGRMIRQKAPPRKIEVPKFNLTPERVRRKESVFTKIKKLIWR